MFTNNIGKNYNSHYAKIRKKLPNIYSKYLYIVHIYTIYRTECGNIFGPQIGCTINSGCRVESRCLFSNTFFQQFWKNIKRQWSKAEKSTKKAQKKEKKKYEEHDQQKRIFMTLENDLLYVLDSAHLPRTVSVSLTLSSALSIRS